MPRTGPCLTFSCPMRLLLAGCTFLAGCELTGLEKVRQAYDQADYASAYRQAELLAQRRSGPARWEASYLAGMAAYHLRDTDRAQHHLGAAVQSPDPTIAGSALAQLGLIHSEQANHALAARRLLEAAERLRGEDQAHALLSAATAQQKLGQWSNAALNLDRARQLSTDQALMTQAGLQRRYYGYAIQVGAFAVENNARRAAEQIQSRASQLQLGGPRLVSAVSENGRHLVLVQLGHFNDHASADAARRRLPMAADVVPVVRR